MTVTGCQAITLGEEAIEIDSDLCYGCGRVRGRLQTQGHSRRSGWGDRHMSGYDIYLVGVGGQGVLTIGEVIAAAAFQGVGRSTSIRPRVWPSAAVS